MVLVTDILLDKPGKWDTMLLAEVMPSALAHSKEVHKGRVTGRSS